MRIFKTLIIAAFAFATAAGTLLAADDPLEIHGGGRVGWMVNGKLGAEGGTGASNELGSMPNYGSSNYFALSFAKKVTAENGAWAKTYVGLDWWKADIRSDLQEATFRRRDFHVEFGGLDFLPAGAVLWGGLRGYGTGWNGQQDHGFIDFNGMGFGIQNIGGVFSLAYMHERDTTDTDSYVGLGEHVTHNMIASVNVPVADVYGVFGYSKKASKDADGNSIEEKNYTAYALAGIFHAPVMGINVGAYFANGGYARMSWQDKRSDTFIRGDYNAGDEATVKGATGFKLFSLAAWTVTDLAPGLYTATSIRYDMGKGNKDAAFLTDNTGNVLHISSRFGKSLTKNIGVTGTIGFGREWAKEDDASGSNLTKKAKTTIQLTPAVEIGLDTGYWAAPKLQFYGVYTKVDSKHKFAGGAYDGKTSAIDFGMLCTFGF